MDTHKFPDQVKVQTFCLTLIGEARLWYKSLRPVNSDWVSLQNLFRQQYSKIGTTRKQLFHMWRSFHFDENAETIDTYVNRIRQVANLLRYQEPQIKHSPQKIILNLFSYNGSKAGSRDR